MLPIFQLIPSSKWTCALLDVYPVWAEFYEPDEREEIISWGIDEEWLDRQLAEFHHGSDHAMYPLLHVNPFPYRRWMVIKAYLTTSGEEQLTGYIMNEDADPALAIYWQGKAHIFNKTLPSTNRRSLTELRQAWGHSDDPVFPIAYETDFIDIHGDQIAGTFNCPFNDDWVRPTQ